MKRAPTPCRRFASAWRLSRSNRPHLAFIVVYPDSLRNRQKPLAFGGRPDSDCGMIRGGFLSEEDREALIALARDGSRVCRVTRRANALVLLDDGMSCQEVARVLLFDDD